MSDNHQLPYNNGDAVACNFVCKDEPNWGFIDRDVEKLTSLHKQYDFPIGRIIGRGVGPICCRASSIKEANGGDTDW